MKDLKPKYFLYARKSTEDDDHQIMSIEAQLFELREYARKENLEILEEFQESKSAKKPGRELFGEMMTRIEQGEANGIIAWHPDRLARNSVDSGRVIYLVDTEQISFLRFPTFWFEPTPQGKFMLQVAFGQSKYYSDNLVENINRGIRQKVRRGEWLVRAPFGYVNNPKIRNIEPHPTKSRIVVKAFEEYAKGTHTLGTIADFLADHGVSTKGTPPSKASVARMLSNRVYLGFTYHKGEYYDGSFAPIISPTLFEAVQKMLAKKSRPRVQKVPNHFPFAQFARCGECGSMITAQYATNRFGTKYTYYRCTKKRGTCSQSYIQEKDLVSQILIRLQTISLCDAYTDWMLEQVAEWEREKISASQSEVQNLTNKIKASEARLENLVSAYLDGDIPKEIYLKKKDEAMRATAVLKAKMKDFERGGNNWVEPLREWVMDTKQAAFLSSSADLKEIRSFVQKIGTNHTVRDKTAHFSVPVPSQFVAKRRRFLPSAAALPPCHSGFSEREVQFCGPYRI